MSQRFSRSLAGPAAASALAVALVVLIAGLLWAPAGAPDVLSVLRPWLVVAALAAAPVLAGFAFALRRLRRLARGADAERIAQENRLTDRAGELDAERAHVAAASRVKTRFLATMSHELRTPLNAVLGATQLLHQTKLGADQAHLVEAIAENGSALLALIESLLDMSRIQAGELVLASQPFDLADCVEGAVATSAVAARAKQLPLAAIIDPKVPGWRIGDTLRLRQMLLHLLGNGIKFTSGGEVVLRIEPGAAPTQLRIAVSDTGIGFDAARAEQLFEPFAQGDDSPTRRFAGSGLGLAIVRELIEAMGGTVAVSAEPAGGTRFDIELDLPLAAHPVPFNPRAGQPVAFYETHEASALAVGALLERMEFAVQRLRDGADLREWAIRHRPPEGGAPNYWLLVSTDDASVLRLLETAADVIEPSRVIGMTGDVCYDAEQARETMGLARSVIKPVLRSAVISRMGAVENALPDEAEADDAEALPVDAPLVLVVEDDPTNSMIVCSMLRNAGIAHAAAPDGHRALQLIEAEAFDLVLMDWQMPDMDGLEVARRMRRGLAGLHARTVPIVALTANAFPEDRNACLAAGMNDFLAKPVLASRLVETIRHWLHESRSGVALPTP